MRVLIEGSYWKTEEGEYNVQISCDPKQSEILYEAFQGWFNVAEGVDSRKEKKILIFRKAFCAQEEFTKLVAELKHNNIINLKEIT